MISTSNTLFLRSSKDQYSYDDLHTFINFFIAFLKKKKVTKDKPIGIISSSCDEYIFIIAACWQLGIPFVCFNPNEEEQTLQEQLRIINPAIIFTDSKVPQNHSVMVSIGDLRKDNWLHLNRDQTEDVSFGKNKYKEDIFAYFFTSGTTSKPKIVPLKRRQLITAANASANNIKLNKDDFWLLCLPLNHIGGISIILRSLVYKSAIYRTDNFDNSLASLLSKNRSIKAVSLVPTMLHRLLNKPNFQPHPQLTILLGGGPVHASLLDRILKRNINVITSYGMTETCAQIAAMPVDDDSKASTVGHIFEPNKIEIRDNSCNLLPFNELGTIWIKGPQVFDGYVQKENKLLFDDNGWFNTGDFGRINKNGKLYIEARRTDLIVTGGENVSPIEIEEALLKLKNIQQAAVTGLKNEEWGQIVAAAIVVNPANKVSVDEIKAQLKANLAGYKIPKKIAIAHTLPRTESGKVKRQKLRLLLKDKN